MRPKPPRTASFMCMAAPPVMGGLGTWLEAEEMCYPDGGMTRRAMAFNVETGRKVVVRCGIPDTYFSIPCKGGGFVSSSGCGTFLYTPPRREGDGHGPRRLHGPPA